MEITFVHLFFMYTTAFLLVPLSAVTVTDRKSVLS